MKQQGADRDARHDQQRHEPARYAVVRADAELLAALAGWSVGIMRRLFFQHGGWADRFVPFFPVVDRFEALLFGEFVGRAEAVEIAADESQPVAGFDHDAGSGSVRA